MNIKKNNSNFNDFVKCTFELADIAKYACKYSI